MDKGKRTFIFLALFAWLLILLPTFGNMALQAEPRGLEIAKAAQERHTDRLLDIPGVVGTAVGLGEDGQAVIEIFTEHPGVAGLPAALDGVHVKVRVTGKIVAQQIDPTGRFDRPVPIGVSTGSERPFQEGGKWYCSSGTLGARVTDGTNVYALSNNHVYAQENTGVLGDKIVQPGGADTGCLFSSANEIGTLSTFVTIQFGRRTNNVVDAALALTTTGSVGTGTPSDGYGTPSSMPVDAYVGQLVQKYGRTTGLTLGAVSGVNATVLISYSSGTARFVNQVVVTGSPDSFSDSGDSGSLIVTQAGNYPVALLFAGSSTVTIGNPIAAVLGAFGVTIDGEAPVNIPPVVNKIDPSTMLIGQTIPVTITGSGFVDGAKVTFENGSGKSPSVSNVVVVSGSVITATITVKSAGKPRTSTWDVRVTNPDKLSGVLLDGFEVTP